MTDAQVERCRKRLEQFLKDLLEPMGRSERRHWGAVYIRGLLLNGERKSIEPLADRSEEGNVQALQQFVGQSPWDWMPLWERLGACRGDVRSEVQGIGFIGKHSEFVGGMAR